MVLLVQIGLAILLFFLVNLIGRHAVGFGYAELATIADTQEEAPAFNAVLRIASPLVFIVVVAAIFYALGWDSLVTNIYRVVIIYFAGRLAFNIARGRRLLLRWRYQITIALASSAFAIILYRGVISQRRYLLPGWPDLSASLWLIVVAFIYDVFNRRTYFLGPNRAPAVARYLDSQFRHVQARHGASITARLHDRTMQALAYAILIYESFNRPPLYRWLERHLLFPLRRARTTGIMQVTASRALSDQESVDQGIQVLLDNRAAAESKAREDATRAFHLAPRDSPEEQSRAIERWVAARWPIELAMIYNPDRAYAGEVQIIMDHLLKKHFSGSDARRER